MQTTRTPADDLALQLQREGYSPQLRPSAAGWQCMLFNNRLSGNPPQAEGDTIYDALEAARRHRDSMVAEDGGKKYCKPGVRPIAGRETRDGRGS